MTITYEKFGTRLKALRRKHGVTQQSLAQDVCCSSEFISRMERGLTFPSIQTFTEIVKSLGVSADELLFDTTPDAIGVKNRFDLLVRKLDSDERAYARLAVCSYMDHYTPRKP